MLQDPMRRDQEFLKLYTQPLKQCAYVGVGLLLLLLVLRPGVLAHFSSAFLGGSSHDAGLYIWLVKHNTARFAQGWAALFSDALPDTHTLASALWFNTPAFYPYGYTLAWSDNFILPSLVWGALRWLGLSDAAAWNMLILSAQWLTGFCTYRLAFALSGNLPAALLGAVGFMTLPYLSEHLGHPQNQFAFLLSLTLSAAFRLFAAPSILRAACLGLLIVAAFLCTAYFALFAVLMVAILVASLLLLRPLQYTAREYGAALAGIALGLLPLLLVVGPYLAVRDTFGPRGLYEAYYFAATGLGYLSAPASSLLYGWSASWSHSEGHLFVGFAILALAWVAIRRVAEAPPLRKLAVALATLFGLLLIGSCFVNPTNPPHTGLAIARPGVAFIAWALLIATFYYIWSFGKLERSLAVTIVTNRALAAILGSLVIVFLVLSLGPLGNPEKGHWALGPLRVLHWLMPGFDSVRAVARLGLVVALGLSLLASLGLAQLLKKRAQPLALVAALIALTVIEHHTKFYPLEWPAAASSAFTKLAELADPTDVAIVLPYAGELKSNGTISSWSNFSDRQVTAMQLLQPLGIQSVNGYSGQITKNMRELPSALADFPSPQALEALNRVGSLRWIIYRAEPSQSLNEKLAAYPYDLRPVLRADSGDYLIELITPKELTAGATLLFPSNRERAAQFLGEFSLSITAPPPAPAKKGGKKPAKPEPAPAPLPVTIDVTLNDESLPFTSLTLSPSSQWEELGFEVPPVIDAVRPLSLRFSVDAKGQSAKVYLRRERYLVAKQ